MSMTTDTFISNQEKILDLLEGLDKAKDEETKLWIVNQLQDLGYKFNIPTIEESEPF